ncbi:MAG: VOC family protein [Pirellulaceae bacterium]
MSDQTNAPGTIGWMDLTIKDGSVNATDVRDFYEQVVGWSGQSVAMDGYDDFCMQASNGQTVSGICHAKGENADIPTAWLIYINVADIEAAITKCQSHGGELLKPASSAGGGRFAVLKDPAGAIFAVYQAND